MQEMGPNYNFTILTVAYPGRLESERERGEVGSVVRGEGNGEGGERYEEVGGGRGVREEGNKI